MQLQEGRHETRNTESHWKFEKSKDSAYNIQWEGRLSHTPELDLCDF